MLADFYIPGLSNDMNIAPVEKNPLGGRILHRNSDPDKKRRLR